MKHEKNRRGTKRKVGMEVQDHEKDEKKSCFRHVFWHTQSDCWRGVVKRTRDGQRHYENFDTMMEAAKAASAGLKIPLSELKKGGGEAEEQPASLYKGVFYDLRSAYRHKWMAVIYVKQRGQERKVWKSLGHFPSQILAAKAVAKAKKVKLSELR